MSFKFFHYFNILCQCTLNHGNLAFICKTVSVKMLPMIKKRNKQNIRWLLFRERKRKNITWKVDIKEIWNEKHKEANRDENRKRNMIRNTKRKHVKLCKSETCIIWKIAYEKRNNVGKKNSHYYWKVTWEFMFVSSFIVFFSLLSLQL